MLQPFPLARVRSAAIAAFSAFLLFAIPALAAEAAGSGTVTGRVLNEATGQYLRNAVVSVVGTAISAPTEFGGTYTLTGVPAGETKIAVTFTGLDRVEAAVHVAPGQTVVHDFALTSGDYDKEVVKLGQVVVSTPREGNAKAIMDQRAAVNPVKVIASDAMGNVSEGNVGEFLKLMPGVTMDYVEADTRSARVRGLQAKYVTVLLDGMPPANSGSSNIGTGRAFEFEQLSISNVETVELSKAPTPDNPSSLGGTINLRSKGAFDHKGRVINWSTAFATNSYYASASKTEGWDNTAHYKLLPNYSLGYSDVVFDGKLGVQAVVDRVYTIAAQKNVWLFYNNFDADYSNNASEVPVINRYNYQDGPKPTKRDNYTIRLDYKLTDALRVWARAGLNVYDAKFYNRTIDLRVTTPAANLTKSSQTAAAGRISLDSNQFMQKKSQLATFAAGAAYQQGDFSADLTTQ